MHPSAFLYSLDLIQKRMNSINIETLRIMLQQFQFSTQSILVLNFLCGFICAVNAQPGSVKQEPGYSRSRLEVREV